MNGVHITDKHKYSAFNETYSHFNKRKLPVSKGSEIMRKLILVVVVLILGACAPVMTSVPKEAQSTRAGQPTSPTLNPVSILPTVTPGALSAPTLSFGGDTIQPSFFAMTTVNPDDYPKLSFGTLAHPEVGAWAWVEEKKGVYDFSLFDKYVNNASAHGLLDKTNTVDLAITLGETPPWAASDPGSCKPRHDITFCSSGPTNVQDWADFVKAMMNHYDGVTEPHVRYFELWNEVDNPPFYSGTIPELVNLAKAAYPFVHADSHSIFLTPSVTLSSGGPGSGPAWMAKYLDAGGARYADAGAFHEYIAETGARPYPMPEQDSTSGCVEYKGCWGSVITWANVIRQVFDGHGLAGKPMFDTEGGWGLGNVTDPDLQAAWLARFYLLQAGLHSSDNLQFAAWFTWAANESFNWGTIETATGAATQAGIAFNQVYAWLVGADMTQPCSSASDGTWSCALTRSDGYRALAIWREQDSMTYKPDAAYTDYRDLAGNTHKLMDGALLTLGAKPILLETQPAP